MKFTEEIWKQFLLALDLMCSVGTTEDITAASLVILRAFCHGLCYITAAPVHLFSTLTIPFQAQQNRWGGGIRDGLKTG